MLVIKNANVIFTDKIRNMKATEKMPMLLFYAVGIIPT